MEVTVFAHPCAIRLFLFSLVIPACTPMTGTYSSQAPAAPTVRPQTAAAGDAADRGRETDRDDDTDTDSDLDSTADRDSSIPRPAVKQDPPPPSRPQPPAEQPVTANDYCKGPSAIVGGNVARLEDMVTRSTVRLRMPNSFCSGTIIGPNQIVTAAHCMEGMPAARSIVIEFGPNPSPNPAVITKGYSVHPDFRGAGLSANGYEDRQLFDVAVISFTGKIPTGYGIAPVGSTANLPAGTLVTVAGYGAYFDTDQTERPLSFVQKAATFDRNYKELQLQVGGGKGACYGDSGGPSYIISNNGLCLMTLSTTTGPSRISEGTCTQGGGTLMDITAYQGWMRCAYEKLGSPLPYLLQDASKSACNRLNSVP